MLNLRLFGTYAKKPLHTTHRCPTADMYGILGKIRFQIHLREHRAQQWRVFVSEI
jgi:hypothetical protein